MCEYSGPVARFQTTGHTHTTPGNPRPVCVDPTRSAPHSRTPKPPPPGTSGHSFWSLHA